MALASVNGLTRLYPVVGSPVSQVQAPAMFNPVFADCGINALVVPLDLPADEVMRTCRTLLASPSIGGLLVTVPYKKALYALVDRAGEEAQIVGAVNAIRRDADGAIVGDLFDGQGFVRGLQAAGRDPAGASVLLLGAGGAGSAIAAALAIANVASLRIFDPDETQAQALAQRLQQRAPRCDVQALAMADARGCDMVVNATPLGMKPSDALPIDPHALAAGTLVADIIMQPAETRLLQVAAACGLPTHPGRPMLAHQLSAYLQFFGHAAAANRVASRLANMTA